MTTDLAVGDCRWTCEFAARYPVTDAVGEILGMGDLSLVSNALPRDCLYMAGAAYDAASDA